MNRRIVPAKFASTKAPVLAEAKAALLDSPPSSVPATSILNGSGMSASAVASPVKSPPRPPSPRKLRSTTSTAKSFAAVSHDEHGSNRQAELFYLQKQIQLQTQMVFVLEDGSRIQGVVEWYDRHSIKLRGKSRVLIYKTAIKYLYKAGEMGSGLDS